MILSAVFLPLLLACPGGGDRGLVTGPPSGDPIDFQFRLAGVDGQPHAVAGSYGSTWVVYTNPAVGGGSRVHFSGPGTLTDIGRNPLDLSRSDLPGGGWYIPPATVPVGGSTATLSIEAYWTPTQQWFRSPDYTIQVVQQTVQMSYVTGFGTPTTATLHAGEIANFGTQVIPRPLDFQQHADLIPSQSTSGSLGSVTITPVSTFQWKVAYSAPSTITVPLDITVRAIAHDPWFNLDPQVDFIVHLVPN